MSLFLSFVFDISTKDPGQKPFSFKIGQGAVIKGKVYHFMRNAVSICIDVLYLLEF